MKKFAVFDIDGTLYRWQLYHDLFRALATTALIPEDTYEKLDEYWNRWRSGDVSFDTYERFVVKNMLENFPLIDVATYERACDEVIKHNARRVYHYPKALLKKLKEQNFLLIAISGSQQELVSRFCEYHDFDIAIGAQYERKDGKFTGEIMRSTMGKKANILHDIVAEHNLSYKDSFAIGDSDGDATLLELVDHPIAFNPTEGLFERAKQEGWSIVLERKNIAYRLEKSENGLILAETITY